MRRGRWAAFSFAVTAILCGSGLVITGTANVVEDRSRRPETAITSTSTASTNPSAPASQGAGELKIQETQVPSKAPNGFCATKDLGTSIRYKGKTYTCKAPKPYRWRR